MNTNRYQFSRILHPKVNSPELGEQSLNKLDYMKCILNMERVFDTEKNGLSIVDFFYGIDVAKRHLFSVQDGRVSRIHKRRFSSRQIIQLAPP